MRVAAIDVGTNSARLLVAEGLADGFRSIERRMTITRLGQGVDTRRILAPEALERTFAAIADYAATCGELGVQRIRVTGTSAVRDARNRDEFFEGVKRLTGTDAELLSGEDEARATFLGTLSDLAKGDPVVVVDIGGGSTELILGTTEPERLISLDIGCVRLFEKYLHSDPPTNEEFENLREEAVTELKRAAETLKVPPTARLIGVAGTVTQLATLKIGLPLYDPDVTHHVVLSHGDVRALSRRLKSLTYAQRKRIKGLEPGRADVIVAGAEILLCVMETLDLPEVLVSEKDILDGLVIQLLAA
ncbi:MAG: exopolyphosphatase / guanosine-5-triphosphate,3-diphosphate pyrophosphatase [Actinomycetota bacterium]|nr:exopolyphosphatase / guanosine-5-triphosphate,3-diphosphate pyrophosphatase [Actinomycetota bacterium]